MATVPAVEIVPRIERGQIEGDEGPQTISQRLPGVGRRRIAPGGRLETLGGGARHDVERLAVRRRAGQGRSFARGAGWLRASDTGRLPLLSRPSPDYAQASRLHRSPEGAHPVDADDRNRQYVGRHVRRRQKSREGPRDQRLRSFSNTSLTSGASIASAAAEKGKTRVTMCSGWKQPPPTCAIRSGSTARALTRLVWTVTPFM